MSYYKSDRVERKNRRKAVLITAILYLGMFGFFVSKDNETWKEYILFAENIFDQNLDEDMPVVVSSEEIRP